MLHQNDRKIKKKNALEKLFVPPAFVDGSGKPDSALKYKGRCHLISR